MRRFGTSLEPLEVGAALLKAGVAAALARAAGLRTALSHRRAVRRLAELDDRTLKDIGLARSDVTGALAQSLAVDPSRILQVRRVAQRAGSRAVAPVTARTGAEPGQRAEARCCPG